jgi:hypothetical protein
MVAVDSRRVPRVPRYSGTCQKPHHFCLRGYHPLWPVFPDCSANGSVCNFSALNRTGPTTPKDPKTFWFGLFRVRSPLLTESLICFRSLAATNGITDLFSLPSGTKMVHFPEFASPNLCIQSRDTALSVQWVSPFGNPRINACLRLPEAYRS